MGDPLQGLLFGLFGFAPRATASGMSQPIGAFGQALAPPVADQSALRNMVMQQTAMQSLYQHQMAITKGSFGSLMQNIRPTNMVDVNRVHDIATAQDMAFFEDAVRELDEYLKYTETP